MYHYLVSLGPVRWVISPVVTLEAGTQSWLCPVFWVGLCKCQHLVRGEGWEPLGPDHLPLSPNFQPNQLTPPWAFPFINCCFSMCYVCLLPLSPLLSTWRQSFVPLGQVSLTSLLYSFLFSPCPLSLVFFSYPCPLSLCAENLVLISFLSPVSGSHCDCTTAHMLWSVICRSWGRSSRREPGSEVETKMECCLLDCYQVHVQLPFLRFSCLPKVGTTYSGLGPLTWVINQKKIFPQNCLSANPMVAFHQLRIPLIDCCL